MKATPPSWGQCIRSQHGVRVSGPYAETHAGFFNTSLCGGCEPEPREGSCGDGEQPALWKQRHQQSIRSEPICWSRMAAFTAPLPSMSHVLRVPPPGRVWESGAPLIS